MQGFTLIEVMIVVVIMLMLISVVIVPILIVKQVESDERKQKQKWAYVDNISTVELMDDKADISIDTCRGNITILCTLAV